MTEQESRTNQAINFDSDSIANDTANTNQPNHRTPVGSDYDLDKVKVKAFVKGTPLNTLAVLHEIVHNGTFISRSFESICCELIALHERKNKDYGGAFDDTMRMFGPTALAIRLHDKVNRVISLVKNNKAEVQDEAIEDTLKDIACYAIMGLEHLYNSLGE